MTSLTPPGLTGQMLTLVFEEAYLCEIGQQVTEYLGDERRVVHGPWGLEDCRDVLLRWFDRGWLECIAQASGSPGTDPGAITHSEYDADWSGRAAISGQHFVLNSADARLLLADPAIWVDEHGPGVGVMLCRSDLTDGLSYDDWAAAVSDIEGRVRGE